MTLIIKHNDSGFFSCCSLRLNDIVDYFNNNKCLPETVNSSNQFTWYKPKEFRNRDITYDYFENENALKNNITII